MGNGNLFFGMNLAEMQTALKKLKNDGGKTGGRFNVPDDESLHQDDDIPKDGAQINDIKKDPAANHKLFTDTNDYSSLFSNNNDNTGKLKLADISGKNKIGKLIANITDQYTGVIKHGRNSTIQEMEADAKTLRMTTADLWCTIYNGVVTEKLAEEIKLHTGADTKNLFLYSASSLDLMDQYKKNHAFESSKKIGKDFHEHKIDPEELIGKTVFWKREKKNGGHTGIIRKAYYTDEGKLMIETSEGDLRVHNKNHSTHSKDSMVGIRTYAMADLLYSSHANYPNDGKYHPQQFLGFGDPNKVVENKNPTLAAYLHNKDNLDIQKFVGGEDDNNQNHDIRALKVLQRT